MSRSSSTPSPTLFVGLSFSLLSLLSYSFVLDFSETVLYIWLILYISFGLYLISRCLSLREKLVSIPFLLFAGFSPYRLFAVPLFYLWLIRTESSDFKYEHLFSTSLFCFPALFLLINLLGYYFGFSTIVFIWFFGLPLLLLSLIISLLPKNSAVVILIACNIFLISDFSMGEKQAPTFYEIKPDHSHSALGPNSLLGISRKVKSISCKDIPDINDENPTLTAILPEVPDLLENFKFPTKRGAIYLFGEHDNLGGFKKGDIGKEFNSDRYQRKKPWEIYHPITNYAFLPNFNRSPIYCSNLGCTLSDAFKGVPLIWDYTDWGFPIILGKFTRDKQHRLFLFGDSDPIVNFLAPYDRYFLYDLYHTSSWKWLYMFLPILLIGSCFYIKNHYLCIFWALTITVLVTIFGLTVRPPADITVVTDGKWLCPHYDQSFSSLPKHLAQQGYTVAISKKCNNASYNIVIANNYVDLKKCDRSSTKTLVLGMPNSRIHLINGQTIVPQDIPLGSARVSVNGGLVIVKDIRNLDTDNRSNIKSPLSFDRTCIVGTGNPGSITIIKFPND